MAPTKVLATLLDMLTLLYSNFVLVELKFDMSRARVCLIAFLEHYVNDQVCIPEQLCLEKWSERLRLTYLGKPWNVSGFGAWQERIHGQ
jgi:hypothetical protein